MPAKSKQTKEQTPSRFKRGDVWWARNLPAENGGLKDRPVVIVSCDGESVRYYKCTTQHHVGRPQYRIEDPLYAGMDKDSFVDTSQICEMTVKKLARKLGELCEYDLEGLNLLRCCRRIRPFILIV